MTKGPDGRGPGTASGPSRASRPWSTPPSSHLASVRESLRRRGVSQFKATRRHLDLALRHLPHRGRLPGRPLGPTPRPPWCGGSHSSSSTTTPPGARTAPGFRRTIVVPDSGRGAGRPAAGTGADPSLRASSEPGFPIRIGVQLQPQHSSHRPHSHQITPLRLTASTSRSAGTTSIRSGAIPTTRAWLDHARTAIARPRLSTSALVS